MKKIRKLKRPQFVTRSLRRKEKNQRWFMAAGVIFCTLVLASFVKMENLPVSENLHHSACKNDILPIYLGAQGSFVPEEIAVSVDFAPEATEVVEFFANPHWSEKSRLEGEGVLQVVLGLDDREVKRDFATIYLRVKSDNVIKYEITEKNGETILTTGFDKFLTAEKGC